MSATARAMAVGRRPGEDPTRLATVSLTLLTLAAAAGMGRLFSGPRYLLPFAFAGLVGHGVMWGGRRRGVPLAANVALALGALALVSAWVVLPGTTTLGVPGPGTLRAAADALREAWSDFDTIVAPAPVRDGFVLAGMAGVGATAVLADWAAFRMGVLFEAVLPSFTLFVFTAALGADERRGPLVALWLVALLGFLLTQHWGLRAGASAWFASRAAGGRGALVQAGAVVGLAAVAAGLLVGPRLPGADDPPILALRAADRPGGGRRTTVSPLVDIRGRLVDRSASEVFTVRATTRSYWRLTSLDTFDGDIWSSDASYDPTGSRLPRGVRTGVPTDRSVQEFTIQALASIWLPAAYRPERLGGVRGVSYNEDLGSIITDEDTSDGLTYQVVSAIPRLTAATLRGAPARPPGGDSQRFLRLSAVGPRVARLADTIAAASDGSAYGRARALQDFFHQGFTYDLSATAGHDANALESFLFRTRRGYCEQFAGAYGVLARAMGLATRVAVGFTPGELGTDGLYHVRGLNAHAWPEVFLAGAGWVAFEPTPGRGAPGAEGYTGLPEAQARPGDPSTATTAAPATTVPDDASAGRSATTAPTDPGVRAGAPATDAGGRRLLRVMAVALAAVLAAAAAVPAGRRLRRRRRRATASTPADRVLVAWTEAAEALATVGAARQPAETLAEHAGRAARSVPGTGPPMARLAEDAARSSYSAGPVGTEVAERAVASAAAVEATVRALTPRWRRAVGSVDPRPPHRRAPGHRDRRR